MSNKEERKAPVLRFKGFTDDWEQRKFGDFWKLKSGKAYKASEYVNKGIPIINGETIKNGEIKSNNLNYLPKRYLLIKDNIILKPDDVVIGLNRPIINNQLKISPIPKNIPVSFLYQRAGKIESKFSNLSTIETYYLLERNIFNFSKITAIGSDQPFIKTSALLSWKFFIPKEIEEKTINKLLAKISTLIFLQQRKLKELQQVKQTLSQFLLNGNTHTRPTLRLNGFEDIWKENKLKDIAKISMGQSPSSNNYNKKGNGKILIQGNADIDNGGIRPRVWTTEITKLANKNDILLTVRAPVGELAITNREVVIGRGIAAIKGNKFIYNLLVQKNKEHFWDRISSGSTFKSISSNDIKQLKVYIPSEKEETLIASVLETIKNKIDFQNERINVINKLKKYLLTNLFI